MGQNFCHSAGNSSFILDKEFFAMKQFTFSFAAKRRKVVKNFCVKGLTRKVKPWDSGSLKTGHRNQIKLKAH